MTTIETKLSNREIVVLNRLWLGGWDALRTTDYSASTKTIASLMRKNLLAKHGLSDKGLAICKNFNAQTPSC